MNVGGRNYETLSDIFARSVSDPPLFVAVLFLWLKKDEA